MKFLTAAAIAIMTAALTVSAYSQGGGLARPPAPSEDVEKQKAEEKKAQEKTYKDAVSKIPTAKDEYDPWAGVREKEKKVTPPAKNRR